MLFLFYWIPAFLYSDCWCDLLLGFVYGLLCQDWMCEMWQERSCSPDRLSLISVAFSRSRESTSGLVSSLCGGFPLTLQHMKKERTKRRWFLMRSHLQKSEKLWSSANSCFQCALSNRLAKCGEEESIARLSCKKSSCCDLQKWFTSSLKVWLIVLCCEASDQARAQEANQPNVRLLDCALFCQRGRLGYHVEHSNQGGDSLCESSWIEMQLDNFGGRQALDVWMGYYRWASSCFRTFRFYLLEVRLFDSQQLTHLKTLSGFHDDAVFSLLSVGNFVWSVSGDRGIVIWTKK